MSSPQQSDRHRPRVAIIGGGISGLTAAFRLTELAPQTELALFEAANRLGGVIRTAEHDNCLVEQAADSFITKSPWALDLCRRIGLDGELISTNAANRRAFVVRGGRLLPVPDGFVIMMPRKLWPVLTSPVLSWRGKLRLLAEPLIQMRPDASDPSAPANEQFDESVAAFTTRRLGHEAFERLVQPLLVGIYTADPAKLSIAATMPEILAAVQRHGGLLRAGRAQAKRTDLQPDQGQISALAESGARYGLFVAPRQGMESLIEALARRLPASVIRLGVTVAAIRRAPSSGWLVNADDHADPQPFEAVIVALPAPAAAQLFLDADSTLAAELSQIQYAGCAVVSMAYRCAQIRSLPPGFGFVVPLIERRQILAASFASEKFADRAPIDEIIIRAFLGGALQPALLDRSEADLAGLAHRELAALLAIDGLPLWADVAMWPRSMPQYHVGHLERVARIEARVAVLPRLELAGNAYRGVGIPQCIRSGELAAERTAAALAVDGGQQ
jgi:oxygen-dependent protoporphyrinogen oxidase